jgi:hypothetical protein
MSPTHKKLILLLIEHRIEAERALGVPSAVANAAALEAARDAYLNALEELEYLRDREADRGPWAD